MKRSIPDDSRGSSTNPSPPDSSGPQFRRAEALEAVPAESAPPPSSNIRPLYSEAELKSTKRPEAVGDIVDRFMAAVGGGRVAPTIALAARWQDVVGPDYSAKTAPGSWESGRLVVLVCDGAAASKLRFSTSQIMQNVAEIVGSGVVTSISFRVSPSVAEKPTR